MNLNKDLLRALMSNPSISISDLHKNLINSIDGDFNLEEINFDSLAKMELSIWLELELRIIVTDHEMSKITTFKGLRSLIQDKFSHKEGASK